MNTTLNAHFDWSGPVAGQTTTNKAEGKLNGFVNSQKKNVTAWFLVSLMVQGVFFLPIPALLIFSFGAPAYILVFTLGLFFANIIAGMSNAGAKVIMYLFATSVVVHLVLLAIFTL